MKDAFALRSDGPLQLLTAAGRADDGDLIEPSGLIGRSHARAGAQTNPLDTIILNRCRWVARS
jgi:hypothetical protein